MHTFKVNHVRPISKTSITTEIKIDKMPAISQSSFKITAFDGEDVYFLVEAHGPTKFWVVVNLAAGCEPTVLNSSCDGVPSRDHLLFGGIDAITNREQEFWGSYYQKSWWSEALPQIKEWVAANLDR